MSVRNRGRRLRGGAPPVLVAALALENVRLVIRMTWERIAESPKGIARSADAARRALRGAAYVETVARAASLLPEDGGYALAITEGGRGGRGRPRRELGQLRPRAAQGDAPPAPAVRRLGR